jgi:hypothetical protein
MITYPTFFFCFRELKHEKETILVHFQQLKGQMSKSRGQERQQLIELTVQVWVFNKRRKK